MEIEIHNTPIHFRLLGKGAGVPDRRFGQVGFQLMNEVWGLIKSKQVVTTGINHWVYRADGSLFVGVEPETPRQCAAIAELEWSEIELKRYLKHLHIGPYQDLPSRWQGLKTELAARGESISSPSLEIYGHHCDDPNLAETTILISLK